MKFVMTGHKGLIGSYLLKELKKRGHEPVLLIDQRVGKDIRDIDKEEIEEADLFIHLAAFCKINKTIQNPELAYEHNVKGMHKVMEFCRKNDIPKIVYTSSSRTIEKDKNPYTASKIYGEELCKGYQQCYGIDYVIIRPSTVYGPFDDKTSRVMDIFIRNAMKGKKLKIFGDENKTLDFTYIDDFIQGFLLAMKEDNEAFDIGSGKAVKLSYVADLIIDQVGKGEKVFEDPEKAQPQHVKIDTSKIEKLGYEPQYSIEEGVKKTVDWYLENIG